MQQDMRTVKEEELLAAFQVPNDIKNRLQDCLKLLNESLRPLHLDRLAC